MGKTTGNFVVGRTNFITKYMDLKRKSGTRISSPTGETSSPPSKNAKASPNKEIDHTPAPKEITPQRDKSSTGTKGEEKKQRRDKKTRSPQNALFVETKSDNDTDVTVNGIISEKEETQEMEVDQDRNQEHKEVTPDADGVMDMETESSYRKDYPPLPTVATQEKVNLASVRKTQSTLQDSFVNKAKEAKDKPPPFFHSGRRIG